MWFPFPWLGTPAIQLNGSAANTLHMIHLPPHSEQIKEDSSAFYVHKEWIKGPQSLHIFHLEPLTVALSKLRITQTFEDSPSY